MEIRTEPASRFGWQGQTLEFVVTAEGATDISAAEVGNGLDVRVTEVRRVGNGVQADVEVEVVDSSFFCDLVPIEVRDETGAVQESGLGVATGHPAIIPVSAAIGILALVGAVLAIRWGGWAGWLLGIVGGLVALTGLVTFGFMVFGRYTGLPWGFAG